MAGKPFPKPANPWPEINRIHKKIRRIEIKQRRAQHRLLDRVKVYLRNWIREEYKKELEKSIWGDTHSSRR